MKLKLYATSLATVLTTSVDVTTAYTSGVGSIRASPAVEVEDDNIIRSLIEAHTAKLDEQSNKIAKQSNPSMAMAYTSGVGSVHASQRD